ncbi:uncharacterized protein GGS22DRAFT_193306 [Annulohypoxylon maeteangense]|uniref:uncharacterized protein n=1 Tax=Annulohypoxylon maeteangense TaxID=1927788 RepID=UPI002007FA58|nr:uncharacterized protein GGS22DRAFT_193306 [Annulohypoxylon maeteangense]KAI0880377.1 hypothetical protein GGS22DRAFT_193306 [Annulohypoxylon maeteangense]
MSKLPTISSPEKTPSPEGQSPSHEPSHDSPSSRYREEGEEDPNTGLYPSQDLSDHFVDFSVEPLSIISLPPKTKSASGDLSSVRQNLPPLPPIPLLALTPYQPTHDMSCHFVYGHNDKGQKQVSLPEPNGMTIEVKGYLDLDKDEVYKEWLGTGKEDNGWSIIDKSVEAVGGSEVLGRSYREDIELEPVNGAIAEQPEPKRLRVHPLFTARYGDDPNWGSMAESGEGEPAARTGTGAGAAVAAAAAALATANEAADTTPQPKHKSTRSHDPEARIPFLAWFLVGGTGRPPKKRNFMRMARERNEAGRKAKAKSAPRK